MGEMEEGGWGSEPGSTEAKKFFPAVAGAQISCSSLFTAGVGWGLLGEGGGSGT